MTVLAPMDRKQYTDFLYEILKAVPRGLGWGFRKIRNGDYRLLKSDLYKIAGIKSQLKKQQVKYSLQNPVLVPVKDKNEVIKELENYKRILDIKIRKYHDIKCEYLCGIWRLFSYSG